MQIDLRLGEVTAQELQLREQKMGRACKQIAALVVRPREALPQLAAPLQLAEGQRQRAEKRGHAVADIKIIGERRKALLIVQREKPRVQPRRRAVPERAVQPGDLVRNQRRSVDFPEDFRIERAVVH